MKNRIGYSSLPAHLRRPRQQPPLNNLSPDSPVETDWVRKSLGEEETYEKDITTQEAALTALGGLAQQVSERLRKSKLAGRTVQLKVKYHDFKTITRRNTVDAPVSRPQDLFGIVRSLIPATQIGERPVRLLGIAVSNFE